MRRAIAVTMALAVFGSQVAWGRNPSWNKIHYLGGTIDAKVNTFDWNTTLTIETDAIVLTFVPRQTVRIKPSLITSITQGQEAYRKVGEIVTVTTPAKPPPLFGMIRRGQGEMIGLVFQTEDGKTGAVLLDALFHWSILQALATATGKTVEIKPQSKP
jgi:hypothetical protein